MQQETTSPKLFVAALTGNILEWYDFSLYGYFAPILSKLFFPIANPFLSLLATFAVFAAGFLMRPIGAIIFGFFADRFGRKKTLALTVIMMAIPTTAIGLLPTYQQIGPLAGVLLTLCRLVQGCAVGGEVSSSTVYIMEHSPHHQRGLFSSFIVASGFAALLLSSLVTSLTTHILPHTSIEEWGWRIPFILGFIVGIVGLYLRLIMPETPTFLLNKLSGNLSINPLSLAFRTECSSMVKIIFLEILPAMSFYMLFIYLSSYMHVFLKLPFKTAVLINTINIILMIIILPLVGMLSDRIGRRPVMIIGALGFCIFSFPMFVLLSKGTFINVLLAQSLLTIFLSFAGSVIPAIMAEMFNTSIRCTALALPYNIANAVVGGTAPLIATFLVTYTGSLSSPSLSLIAGGIIMLITLAFTKETFLNTLAK